MGSSLGICLHLISPFIVLSTASRSLFLEENIWEIPFLTNHFQWSSGASDLESSYSPLVSKQSKLCFSAWCISFSWSLESEPRNAIQSQKMRVRKFRNTRFSISSGRQSILTRTKLVEFAKRTFSNLCLAGTERKWSTMEANVLACQRTVGLKKRSRNCGCSSRPSGELFATGN